MKYAETRLCWPGWDSPNMADRPVYYWTCVRCNMVSARYWGTPGAAWESARSHDLTSHSDTREDAEASIRARHAAEKPLDNPR